MREGTLEGKRVGLLGQGGQEQVEDKHWKVRQKRGALRDE
jgi:hypothetical protein